MYAEHKVIVVAKCKIRMYDINGWKSAIHKTQKLRLIISFSRLQQFHKKLMTGVTLKLSYSFFTIKLI